MLTVRREIATYSRHSQLDTLKATEPRPKRQIEPPNEDLMNKETLFVRVAVVGFLNVVVNDDDDEDEDYYCLRKLKFEQHLFTSHAWPH